MGKTLSIIFSVVLLASCATTKTNVSPEDRAVFKNIENAYQQCLGEKTGKYINGSDDVDFLTKHVMSLCEGWLSDLYRAVISRGFSAAYATGYTRGAREVGRSMTSSFILSEKSKNKPKPVN